jgi:hypothetical protein
MVKLRGTPTAITPAGGSIVIGPTSGGSGMGVGVLVGGGGVLVGGTGVGVLVGGGGVLVGGTGVGVLVGGKGVSVGVGVGPEDGGVHVAVGRGEIWASAVLVIDVNAGITEATSTTPIARYKSLFRFNASSFR